MARLAATAVAGYYPTPAHIISHVARIFGPCAHGHSETRPASLIVMDPCAGEGAALSQLQNELRGKADILPHHVIGVEMESGRYKELSKRDCIGVKHHADIMCLSTERIITNFLYLNPPYDTDKEHGRLEEKFLAKLTPVLGDGGELILVVPYYALAYSTETLATHYHNFECYRFDDEDFSAYKQVVLFATRRYGLLANAGLSAQVETWAKAPHSLDVISSAQSESRELPRCVIFHPSMNFLSVDATRMQKEFKLWSRTYRSVDITVPTFLPEGNVLDRVQRVYELATNPRPVHIAAGIAAGVFNGCKVKPNEEASHLPELLVKGVFRREFRTSEEKTNKEGEVTSIVQVQQPHLETHILDLSTYQYLTLKSGIGVPAENPVLEELSTADLLFYYSKDLMRVLEEHCPTKYGPQQARDIVVHQPRRQLFPAQEQACKALVTLLGGPCKSLSDRSGLGAILLGEIGSGKSSVALLTADTCQAESILIVCPPHLLQSWKNEVDACLPCTSVHVLQNIQDVQDFQALQGRRVGLLSREAAKLGSVIEGVGARCPKCGAAQLTTKESQASRRLRCEQQEVRMTRYADLLTRYITDNHRIMSRDLLKYVAPSKHRWVINGKDRVVPSTWPDLPEEVVQNVWEAALRHDCDISRALHLLVYQWNSDQLFTKLQEAKEAQAAAYYSVSYKLAQYLTAQQRKELQLITYSQDIKQVRDYDTFTAALTTLVRTYCILEGACGEPLYYMTGISRMPLAKYITVRAKQCFDFLIVDECHEYSNEDSAQTRSLQKLVGLRKPTVFMTGSIMNGFAKSLFSNIYAVSSEFRGTFDRDDSDVFVQQYGYRKQVISLVDCETKQPVSFGAMTDRVEKRYKVSGDAPGVLPSFLLKYLLPNSVTLQKADLEQSLIPVSHHVHLVTPFEQQKESYEWLLRTTMKKIAEDQFTELSGKLFGQLVEVPSYLDRCTRDVGNTKYGDFTVSYPEELDLPAVATVHGMQESTLLPKEEWLLLLLSKELAEGRNILVFTWHLNLLTRIARLIQGLGVEALILWANKVPTAKRQAWIDKEIVKKGRRILVTNPVAIQTGLNNLVHFSSEVWLENPACNPITYRQAIGRIDRIGQKQEPRVHFPIYKGTLQESMHKLLLHKVGVSQATDGLDPEAAMLAAGVVESDIEMGLSLGKQLYNIINSRK